MAALLCTLQSATAQVVVNEFLFRDSDSRLEFIEILNVSTGSMDLRSVQVSDERRTAVFVKEDGFILTAGAYFVMVRDTLAFDARFDGPRIQVSPWPTLNNGGDAIFLSIDGRPIDSVRFETDWGELGQSIERIDPDGPGWQSTNWAPSQDASGATPGLTNSVYEPDRTPPHLTEAEEWIDGNVIVYASEPLGHDALQSAAIRFASGDRPVSSRLSIDRTKLILEPWSGADVSVVTIEGLVDGSGNRMEAASIVVARQPGPFDVKLNEILFEPLADAFDGRPDQLEFVEVRSLVSHPVAMRGAFLTGRVDERGIADTLRSDDKPRRLAAGGYGYFFATGSGDIDFREGFPSVPSDSIAFSAPIQRQSLLLDNAEDRVKLHTVGGMILDEVSYSRNWHLPELADTRGVSLERISAEAASNQGSNWTSSVSREMGTPGRANSVSLGAVDETSATLQVHPSPFSPDGDGWEDFARIDIRTRRPATSAAVWIFDAAGRQVRSIAEAMFIGPEASIFWDGRDDADQMLAPGVFIVYVEAVDTSAGAVLRYKKPVVIAASR